MIIVNGKTYWVKDARTLWGLNSDRRLELEFNGIRITSDAGLRAYRELDEALGLTRMPWFAVSYNRTGRNTRYGLQWIKEGKYALNWTRLSCHDFLDNQVGLQVFALAINLGNHVRQLALPKSIRECSLRTLREKLIKIGAKVVRHARQVTFKMAEVLVSRSLFDFILKRIGRLKPVPVSTS